MEKFFAFQWLKKGLHHKKKGGGRQNDAKGCIEIFARDFSNKTQGNNDRKNQDMRRPIEGRNERNQNQSKYQEQFGKWI